MAFALMMTSFVLKLVNLGRFYDTPVAFVCIWITPDDRCDFRLISVRFTADFGSISTRSHTFGERSPDPAKERRARCDFNRRILISYSKTLICYQES